MNRTYVYIAAGLLLWAGTTALYFWPPDSPIESMDGDYITPSRVKAGESVVIGRNFRATRDALWTITRVLVRGDCSKSCDRIDLPSSSTTVSEGTYLDNRRPHVIPLYTPPGEWRFEVTIQWDTPFWGIQKLSMPSLTITVDAP